MEAACRASEPDALYARRRIVTEAALEAELFPSKFSIGTVPAPRQEVLLSSRSRK
ncbi:hypothetical protein PGT21_020508 [Puccinia graminis f. sp. tritici]|uniref:Uncharacterized protein n=1 Tax=Puccinia graminis f. sp. tritici TaxID=56615 RepID=A0A5B0M1E5_PUCGR|nr:hypothetical protein PGT21_020508 [Puccinia graminis f. sp. tritici]KAA1125802.1 hypothetical protein PGTUg99_021489 [Puccinia graminis f. sp. tritici]